VDEASEEGQATEPRDPGARGAAPSAEGVGEKRETSPVQARPLSEVPSPSRSALGAQPQGAGSSPAARRLARSLESAEEGAGRGESCSPVSTPRGGPDSPPKADDEAEDVVARAQRLLLLEHVRLAEDSVIFEEESDEFRHHRQRSEALGPLAHSLADLLSEYERMRDAGAVLLDTMERLQDENQQLAGDAAYWRALVEGNRGEENSSAGETPERLPCASPGEVSP